MARIPYPDLTGASEDVRSLAANLPPLNIFRMLPHMPTFLRGFGQLGTAILSQAALDARLRELIILRVGQRSPAPYEWQQHVPIALRVGLTPDEVAGVADGSGAGTFTERQRALLAVSDELLARRALSDATWSAVQASLRDREAIELCMLIGHYQGLASTIGALGIQLDQGPGGPS